MDNKKKTTIAIVFVVIVLVIVGLSFWWQGRDGSPVSPSAKNAPNGKASANLDNVPFADKVLDLKISKDGFSPAKFKARKSDQLSITYINEESEFHNTLKFEDLPFDAIVPNGGTVQFTVIVPGKSGEYVFYTDVNERREGILIVE